MNDLVTFLRNYDYSVTIAKGNKWTLEEAVDYLATYRANSQAWIDRDNAYTGFLSIKEQILKAVRHAVDEGFLQTIEPIAEKGKKPGDPSDGEIDFTRTAVFPLVFINWAVESGIEVPLAYRDYVERYKGKKSEVYESFGIKKSVIHHQRARAVAELLWRLEPDFPLAKMASRTEIIEIGCEGEAYDARTICRWLASLKGHSRPGRPRKNVD